MKSMIHALFMAMTLFPPIAEAATNKPHRAWLPGRFGEIVSIDGREILRVSVPTDSDAVDGMNCASTPLDLTQWRGGELFFSISCRGKNVSIPKLPYNGVKVMIVYRDRNSNAVYAGARVGTGTFDWKTVHGSATIPEEAVDGQLFLGLQDSSGTVEFDTASLSIDGFRKSQSNILCQYSAPLAATPPLRGVMSPRKFKPGDLVDLGKWKVNLLRIQFCRNWLKVNTDLDLEDYDNWMAENMAHLDSILDEAEQLGIRIIVDLHTPPGGWLPGGEARMFHEKKYADHYIKTWKSIAKHFKGRKSVWAYDLINEPVQKRKAPYDYLSIQLAAARVIREIDPGIPLVIESNRAATPETFSYLEPLPLDNVIYSVHFYAPNVYTHQQVFPHYHVRYDYPGEIQGRYYNREELRRILQPVRDFQLRHDARIYIGEFSVAAWAPGAARYLDDCISLFEEYGWDWSYHAFRESRIWSVEHAGPDRQSLEASPDNDRKQVLLRGFKGNQK